MHTQPIAYEIKDLGVLGIGELQIEVFFPGTKVNAEGRGVDFKQQGWQGAGQQYTGLYMDQQFSKHVACMHVTMSGDANSHSKFVYKLKMK